MNSKDWPGRPGRPPAPALYRNNRDGTFTDVTKAAGLAVELYGLGAAAADYDNDGRADLYVTAPRRQPPLPEPGRRDVRGRHGEGGRRRSARRLRHQRRFLRLRQGRPARPVRGQLREVVDREGPVLHPGRQDQVLLHARVVQGPEPDASTATRATAPSRTSRQQGRPARARPPRRWAWRCSTTTATAGPTCFVANDTQPNKLFRNNGNGTFTDVGSDRGRGLQRDRRGPRGHGRGRRRLRRHRPSQRRDRQLLERDDGALPQRGQRPLRRRGAHLHGGAGHAAHPDLRRFLLRLRPRRPPRHLRRQRPRGRRHQAVQPKVQATPSPRTSSATPASASSRTVVREAGPGPRSGPWSRGAPPTRTTTATATWTWWSPPTTARPASCATTAATGTASCACARWARTRTATASARKVTVTLAGGAQALAARSRPARATARRASCRSPSAWAISNGPVDRGGLAQRPGRHGRAHTANQIVTVQEGKGASR